MKSDPEEFQKFVKRFGEDAVEEVLTMICDAAWNGGELNGVKITHTYQHNACNHTYEGDVTFRGEEFSFVVDNGDWAGTVVRQWGDLGDVCFVAPEPPPRATFLPSLSCSNPVLAARIWVLWEKEAWFQEKVHGLNYDRHFAPGGATENHYRQWAESKGMTIGFEDETERVRKLAKEDAEQFVKDCQQFVQMMEGAA